MKAKWEVTDHQNQILKKIEKFLGIGYPGLDDGMSGPRGKMTRYQKLIKKLLETIAGGKYDGRLRFQLESTVLPAHDTRRCKTEAALRFLAKRDRG